MINPQDFTKLLEESGFSFFTGVPDSTLREWLGTLAEKENHIMSANEGEALSIASGYYLASGKPGCVYLQNSGFGNMINPLTSLCDKEVYGIPALLIIGWRGEPKINDEPQHIKMGKITLPLLDVLQIQYSFLPDNLKDAERAILQAKKNIEAEKMPYALVARKDLFEKFKSGKKEDSGPEIIREEAIKIIVDALPHDAVIISTTGKTSRELFEYREAKGDGHAKDFLTVGSMGFASAIAFGITQAEKNKKIVVFDGDGAVLMHLGNMATIGHYAPVNFLHIVFDNRAYESTGGQRTVSESIDFCGIAKSCGYKNILQASGAEEIINSLKEIQQKDGPNFLIIKVKSWSRPGLGRPAGAPSENKKDFMENLWKS
jgi:phosphonopyruvate decarboxylase